MALSCVGTEGLDEISNGEICMSPVLSDMTKARAEGDTHLYPDGDSFGVFAYYNETQAYLENHKFTSVSGICAGDDPVYWPLSGSLIFAGYSPYSESIDAGFDVETKTFTINDYVADGTTDLMYFLPELSGGEVVGYDKSTASVPVEFHHSLSCVSFEIVSSTPTDRVVLKSIKLVSANRCGDFQAEYNQEGDVCGEWKNVEHIDGDLFAFDAKGGEGQLLSTTPETYDVFVVPGSATEIIIAYDILIGDDVQSNTVSINPADYFQSWDISKKYTYNVSISGFEPIIVIPEVEIQHSYVDGILMGSKVTVVLNDENGDPLTDGISNILNIEIKIKRGDVVYKTYSSQTLASNTITFSGDTQNGDKFYLPRGSGYTIEITYDGLSESVVASAKSPDPEVKLYLDFIANSGSVKMYSAEVNISEDVLKEMPLSSSDQYNGRMIGFLGNPTIGFLKSESNMNSPKFLSNIQKTGSPRSGGYYEFQNYVTFDGLAAQVNMSSFNKIETWITPYRIHPIKLTQIKYASEHLKDGGLYVICATQDTQRYWYVDDYTYLRLSESAPSSYGKEHIFRYDFCQATVPKQDGYNQYSNTGAWYSMKTGKYMSEHQYPMFTSDQPARYVVCATGWGSDKRDGPFDIMKGNKELLRYENPVTNAYWSGTEAPDQYWKWNLYEVVVE